MSEAETQLLNPDHLVLGDNIVSESVRFKCFSLIEVFCYHDDFKELFEAMFFSLLKVFLGTSGYQELKESPFFRKPRVACYYAISRLNITMMNCFEKYIDDINMLRFLIDVVQPDLDISFVTPILRGRAIEVCCSFLHLQSETYIKIMVNFILQQITPNSDELLRALCIRALIKTYTDCGEEETTKSIVVRSLLSAVFETCLSTLSSVKYDVQGSLLELTVMLIIYEPQLCLNCERGLMKNTLEITQGTFRVKNAFLCRVLFKFVIPLRLCTEAIQKTWLPYISHVLSSQESSREQRQLMQDIHSVFLHVKSPLNKFSV